MIAYIVYLIQFDIMCFAQFVWEYTGHELLPVIAQDTPEYAGHELLPVIAEDTAAIQSCAACSLIFCVLQLYLARFQLRRSVASSRLHCA